jgi:hypothetical protein
VEPQHPPGGDRHRTPFIAQSDIRRYCRHQGDRVANAHRAHASGHADRNDLRDLARGLRGAFECLLKRMPVEAFDQLPSLSPDAVRERLAAFVGPLAFVLFQKIDHGVHHDA